jgi:predicted homoserine dehydrogenase-like protein
MKRLEPIQIGIVGIGSIGKGMVLQAGLTPGMSCGAICDIDIERAIAWAEALERPYEVVEKQSSMNDTIKRGKLAICSDGNLVAQAERIDVLVEATNSISAGGQHAIRALENEKHVVMMNYESDLIFGPYLAKLAENHGRVYTVADGDQPTVIKRLVDEMRFMGFKLVMAGNIKGYLDRYANPTSIIPEADKRNLDYRMCTSYTDGTKLCVEMAVLANGLGLRTSVAGMHGPRMDDIYQVFDHFDFDSMWDGDTALVDYVLGARPKGGVFAIGFTDLVYQQDTLAWFPPEMGPGPYYLFYRPYHLGHFESMASVARAVLDGEPVLSPDFGFRTNVYAYAKKDLKIGEKLDGIGGYACYGLIENKEDNEELPGIPICLADGIPLSADVSKDEKILLHHTSYDPSEYNFDLFQKAMATAHLTHGGDQSKPDYGSS